MTSYTQTAGELSSNSSTPSLALPPLFGCLVYRASKDSLRVAVDDSAFLSPAASAPQLPSPASPAEPSYHNYKSNPLYSHGNSSTSSLIQSGFDGSQSTPLPSSYSAYTPSITNRDSSFETSSTLPRISSKNNVSSFRHDLLKQSKSLFRSASFEVLRDSIRGHRKSGSDDKDSISRRMSNGSRKVVDFFRRPKSHHDNVERFEEVFNDNSSDDFERIFLFNLLRNFLCLSFMFSCGKFGCASEYF
ncbi:hypothetical protein HK096_011391 [Nowakowskiella sp. JEL0078]|nr:hypothetical protein HK096_011391 [Nowakowskiella sp. JEL0078]